MSNLYWLTEAQMQRFRPYFPKSRGRARVDDRRVLSGIIFINRNGLRWCDARVADGPPKTLYHRWTRWSEMGVFARIMIGLSKGGMNTKLHAITGTSGRPIGLFITAEQVSDYTGAAALMNGLPEAE